MLETYSQAIKLIPQGNMPLLGQPVAGKTFVYNIE